MMVMGTFRELGTYLQNASNKVELFHYLSVAIAQTVFREGKVVLSTLDEDVLGSPVPGADESQYPLRPCNHEEFDTRLMLHAANAVSHGHQRILIIAKNTDTIILQVYRSSVILALPKCGFHLELKTNCGTVQFMTSAVRCFRQDKTSCTRRCSCYNNGLVCTARCRCSGHCYGRSNPPPTPPSN